MGCARVEQHARTLASRAHAESVAMSTSYVISSDTVFLPTRGPLR